MDELVGTEAGGRRGYHHGNLREALIRAALDLIARERAGRLHLRRCRALGRGQLGGALPPLPRPRRAAGRRGAARLRAVRGAVSAGPGTTAGPIPSPPSRMSAGPISPSPAPSLPTIRRCSRPALPLDVDPGLQQAADRAFAVLRRAAETLCARLPPDSRPPALMMSLHVWSLAHGIASLFARGDAGRRQAADDARGAARGGGAGLSARARLDRRTGRVGNLTGDCLDSSRAPMICECLHLHEGGHDRLAESLDDIGKPAWIAPDGPELHPVLAARPRRSGLSDREWTNGMLDTRPRRPLAAAHGADASGGAMVRLRPSARARDASGNRAFDEYREETLRRLEEEQREFRDFLDRLRQAKDKAEFDQFMAERRRPQGPAPYPQVASDEARQPRSSDRAALPQSGDRGGVVAELAPAPRRCAGPARGRLQLVGLRVGAQVDRLADHL